MDKKVKLLIDEIRKPIPKNGKCVKICRKKKFENILKIFNEMKNNKNLAKETQEIKPFIFNQAPKDLWYNWANSIGRTFTAISYSAGTTYFFQNKNPLQPPKVYIFNNNQFNDNKQEEPLYSLTLPAQGIRSALMIDDEPEPYVLLGTFSFPREGITIKSDLYRWNFLTNKLVKLLSIDGPNSIRQLIRYRNDNNDVLFFSTQNDTGGAALPSNIYIADMKDISTKDIVKYKTKVLSFNNFPFFGSVWDFYIDNQTIWISIPENKLSQEKLSGFTSRGRAFYQNIDYFLTNNRLVNIIPIIGNDLYSPGFGIDSLSTFQFQTSPDIDYVYIYSLSDFLYQFLAIQNKINLADKLAGDFDQGVKELRAAAANLDLAGTRIFTVKKNDLFKNSNPYITTVMGNPPIGTINGSTTGDGYNNFMNVYTWASTFDKRDLYFGTLDIRWEAYAGLVDILVGIIGFQEIKPILLAAPEEIVIAITEYFLNINFSIPINFEAKQLHFDVIKVDEKGVFSKITSNGFKDANPSMPDDGVRNLDIVSNTNGKFLLTGSTCYQAENTAKVYTLKL